MSRSFHLFLCLVGSVFLMGAGFLEFDQETGQPYRWNSNTGVNVVIDGGDVNGDINHATAVGLLDDIFNDYNTVTGASLTITNLGSTAEITSSNFNNYVNFTSNGIMAESGSVGCKIADQVAGANLVVFFDEDGSFFSSIGLALGVLGIASPVLYNENNEITCGYLLINGPAVDDEDSFKYIALHELGHALNLAHTQINGDLTASDPEKVPTMYPFIPANPATSLNTPLKLDDRFSYSYLYAFDEIQNSPGIQGSVLDRFGRGVLATNVICRDENDPLVNVVSWISGADLQGQGAYLCGLLPQGQYSVAITPIVTAINIWDVNPPYIPSEFYSGSTESFDPDIDALDDKAILEVQSSILEDIDIIINENGRLINGVVKTGTIEAAPQGGAIVGNLNYFTHVPKNATKATFELKALDASKDIDLLARCGSAFSLSTQTVGPIYSEINPGGHQTEVSSTSAGGEETIVLNSSSSPSIKDCTYHLLVANYETTDVPFTLKVTLEGKTPSLTLDFQSVSSVPNGSKQIVSRLSAKANGDHFEVTELTLTDSGDRGLDGVTLVEVYLDINKNGNVDEDDILVGQTSQITSSSFVLDDLKMNFLDEEVHRYLVVYTRPVNASVGLYAWVGFLISILFVLWILAGKSRALSSVSLILLVFISCGKGSSDHNLEVQDISATAIGFMDNFEIKDSVVSSVQDFFKN